MSNLFATAPLQPPPAVPRFSRWSVLQSLRLPPLLAIGCGYLLVNLVLRIILLLVSAADTGLQPLAALPVLGLGLVNDAIVLCYLLAPLFVLLTWLPERLYHARVGRYSRAVLGWLAFFAMLYLAVMEYYFFKEFNARFNLVAVDYLIYPHEVFLNIYQSYHVITTCLMMATYATAMLCFCWRWLTGTSAPPATRGLRLKATAIATLVVAGLATLVSTHSLDFSGNRILNEIAADGISSFFESLRTNHLDYAAYYHTGEPRVLTPLLDQALAADTSRSQPAGDDLRRVSQADPRGLGPLNVVVIVEESLGCEQVDACKHGLDIDAAIKASNSALTPNLDQLARQGLFFNRAYATGTRTVRGLEAITTSLPPIPSESIIKRPGNDHIANWGQVMREHGYQTSFLYGGYSLFDNMQAFYSGNGFSIKDRSDIAAPRFANIWGVSDQDLLTYARTYFDQQQANGQPFFSIIMTTSNHSPYTFPDGIPGVRAKGGNRLDGVRYADYALGEFFQQAKTSSWYDHTLFVVVADHGARVYGSASIPLPSYEIPLLVLAPGRLSPQQIAAPISQLDIAPTVLGLLGLSYSAPFFGQNVFAESDPSRVLLFNHNHDVALYQNGKLAVLGLRNQVHTYAYRLGDSHLETTAQDPDLVNLATAYYQTAYQLFMQHRYL